MIEEEMELAIGLRREEANGRESDRQRGIWGWRSHAFHVGSTSNLPEGLAAEGTLGPSLAETCRPKSQGRREKHFI